MGVALFRYYRYRWTRQLCPLSHCCSGVDTLVTCNCSPWGFGLFNLWKTFAKVKGKTCQEQHLKVDKPSGGSWSARFLEALLLEHTTGNVLTKPSTALVFEHVEKPHSVVQYQTTSVTVTPQTASSAVLDSSCCQD